jgi:hypothetical protein
MLEREECFRDEGKWCIVLELQTNTERTWKENAEVHFWLDSSGQPQIEVLNFGVFSRSSPRARWRPQETKLRKLTSLEKRTLISRVMRSVSSYVNVRVVAAPPPEPLPMIDPFPEPRQSEVFGDAFSTMQIFTCPLDEEQFERWPTVPRQWKALLVIQVWNSDRIAHMAVYGIGSNWFKTLQIQGIPHGIPSERQRQIMESYFEQHAQMIARRFQTYSDHASAGREIAAGIDPKDSVQ